MATWPALRVQRLPERPELGFYRDNRLAIKITDGRTANLLAGLTALDTFVIDAALNYADTAYLVAAHNQHATEPNKALFLTLLQTLIAQVEFIEDFLALIVARVLSSLMDESVIMVERGLQPGIYRYRRRGRRNSADGIFAWLAQLGQKNVNSTLDNMAQLLHSTRYYPHYSLLNAARPELAVAP